MSASSAVLPALENREARVCTPLAFLSSYGLDVRVLGERSGQASGLKMCYASLTKGLTALATESLVAAQALGLQEPLLAEFQELPFFKTIQRLVPGMPPKAYR